MGLAVGLAGALERWLLGMRGTRSAHSGAGMCVEGHVSGAGCARGARECAQGLREERLQVSWFR